MSKLQTRITTKYSIPNLESPKYQTTKKRKREGDSDAKDSTAQRIPKAALELKTYDPESGVVLKFKTDRAADVGRLIAGLGRLGRHMAALPEKAEGMVARCIGYNLRLTCDMKTKTQRWKTLQLLSRASHPFKLQRVKKYLLQPQMASHSKLLVAVQAPRRERKARSDVAHWRCIAGPNCVFWQQWSCRSRPS